MSAHPESRFQPAAPQGIPAFEAVTRVVDSLLERRGLVRVICRDDASELVAAIGDRLPSTYRWSQVLSPATPAALWAAVFEGEVPAGVEPGPQLRETLWQRTGAGVHTVLGVTLNPDVPDEVLGALEDLAGLEPMLQLVVVTDGTLFERASEAAARLGMRIRNTFTAAEPAPPAPPAMPSPAVAGATPDREGSAATRSTSAADRPAAPEAAALPPNRTPIEAAGQRTFDPFRNGVVRPTIDTPQLLPVLSDPHGLHAEWFRVLRLRLEDWVRGRGGAPQAIALSGSEAGVGKTFVAVNLALLWANSTFERVCLVDGDLRRPQFHKVFEIPQRPGLADVLARRAPAEESVRYVPEVGLHVMPAGRAGNPRQLVNPDRVQRVIGALKDAYDLVILDGPPLTGMVDGHSFADACDGTLLVVRAGRSRLAAVQKAKEELGPERLIGAVVNGAERGIESAYSRYRRLFRR